MKLNFRTKKNKIPRKIPKYLKLKQRYFYIIYSLTKSPETNCNV